MNKSVWTLAIAGLAQAASAQSASLSIVPTVTTVDWTITSTLTLDIYGDADFGDAISGGEVAIQVSGAVEGIVDMVGQAAPWGALGFQDNGYAGNGGYDGMIFGQLIFPPFIPPAPASLLGSGPVYIGSVTVTVESNFFGSLIFDSVAGSGPFVLEIFTGDEGAGSFTQLTDVQFGSASVLVVPGPGAMTLLGLGGLAAGRRRR